jgi:methylenetetrahydrofolate dehydrogenase (NADP+)/methenyltetrahydrofolate cyclohydrolase
MGSWLEGKALADKIKWQVRDEVALHQRTRHQVPGLIGILVGDNRSSQIYLKSKEKACQAVGIASQILTYPGDMEPAALKAEIEELNRRDDVDGILVQLPIPAHFDTHDIICTVSPAKDVDGIHPFNLGNLMANQDGPKPCTPLGIIELLRSSGVAMAGRDAVVIGRSLIVGKPVAAMLTNENATVCVCHSKTRDLPDVARRADILVAAIGRPAFVRPEFVKPGATVIDVGINRVSDKTLVRELFGDDEKRRRDMDEKGYTVVGDVDPRAADRAGLMTPVPGGVGLLTVAMLMKNTLDAFKRRRGLG